MNPRDAQAAKEAARAQWLDAMNVVLQAQSVLTAAEDVLYAASARYAEANRAWQESITPDK